MAEDVTDRLELPLLFAGQALKEMFHNQALARLDMLVQPVVLSADLSVPPATPEPGAVWIVAASPGEEWEGHAGEIACWSNGWLFAAPRAGWCFHVLDRGHDMLFDGTTWTNAALRTDGLYLGDERIVGPRQAAIATASGGSVVDVQARAVLASILSAMRAHGLIA